MRVIPTITVASSSPSSPSSNVVFRHGAKWFDTQVDKNIHAAAPRSFAKSDDPQSKAKLQQVIYNASEALRIIGILLQPFIPTKAGELLDVLGVPETNRTFEHAQLGCDFDYGVAKSDPKINLFPPLVLEE